jgi:flagellin-like protein
MKKLLKSRKALSPVVAAIILIAVTVAVSIAVAAWMGALTFTFMKTEELRIVGVKFETGNITITVQNTGTSDSVISNMKVEDEIYAIHTANGAAATSLELSPEASGTVVCDYSWTAGTSYNVAVVTRDGNIFTYRTSAPTS